MPIAASDIVFLGSATMPENDATTQIGGAVAAAVSVVFTDLDANGTVEVISTNAADTMNLTVYGRNAAGEIVSETKALNGTTVVSFTTTFKRLMKAVLASAAAGTVTLRKAAAAGDLMEFLPGITHVRRVFYDVAADVAGGSTRKFYEKIFAKNKHATDALTNAKISLPTNPGDKIAFALEAALDGSDTNGAGNNRLVAPGGYTFTTAEKNVVNSGNHSPTKVQGIWLELTLAAGAAAAAETFEIKEMGTNAA